MENEIIYIGKRIIDKKVLIATEVNNSRTAEYTDLEKEQIAPFEKELIVVRAQFVSLFGEVLRDQLEEAKAMEIFSKWGKETGEMIYKGGAPLEEALKDTKYYRTYIWKAIKEEVMSNDLSMETVFKVGAIINPLLDHAAYAFSLAFIKHFESNLINAREAILELSTPVVCLMKGNAILPLIGNIDTERAKLLIEHATTEASRLNLRKLIVDLSGVPIVDTMVADQIFKLINSLRLIGVEAILSGVRPEVAQTIVGLGISFEDITIVSGVERALEEMVK